LFTKVIYRNKPVPPFVMELPPYRAPNVRIIMRSVIDRTSAFVRKAGTIILSVSIVVWLLLAIPAQPGVGSIGNVAPSDSIFGTVSRTLAPVFAPAGFGTWQASGALVTGILAKEVVVSTLSQTYVGTEETHEERAAPTSFFEDLGEIATSFAQSTVLTGQEIVNIIPRTLNIIPVLHLPELNVYGSAEEEAEPTALEAALAESFTPLAAVAFCVFILLYVPCMTAVTAMRHEFGTRWMLLQSGYALGVAWLAATLVYQVGHLVVGG
jgi:ferrous iron transport protein B